MNDPRLAQLRARVETMKQGQFDNSFSGPPTDDIDRLGLALQELAILIKRQLDQVVFIARITEKANAGLLIDEVLNHIYEAFQSFVPYDRIGVSLLDEHKQIVRAIWVRSAEPGIKLPIGYMAPLKGSSLQHIIETGQPRIINDLERYLFEHPRSESTALIVQEGMRASLTCPLVSLGQPVGFLFFSSVRAQIYQAEHVQLIKLVAGQLALIIEKSRLYERMVALNEEKNTVLGMAAHDLRGPITIVQGFIELLEGGFVEDDSRRRQEIYTLIRRTTKTMLALIDSFLDFSVIESGHLELELLEMPLAQLLQEVHAANQLLAQAKSITLLLEIETPLPTVCIDPNRMNQILNNLISNALKFSSHDSAVKLQARTGTDSYEIRVTDQGPGISQQDLPHLFLPFDRGMTRPTAGEKSSGLGLAIVQRMVTAHHGTIEVESKVGQGTTFILTFPLRPPTVKSHGPRHPPPAVQLGDQTP